MPFLFLFVICFAICLQPIGLAVDNYIVVSSGISFVSSNGGPVLFGSSIRTSRIYFDGGFVYFQNFRFPNNHVWPYMAFTCSDNANVTLNLVNKDKVTFIVDAPTGQDSVSKIKTSSNLKPREVLGATSWSFTGTTTTVNIENHLSPREITILLGSNAISSSFFSASNILISLLPILVLWVWINDIQEGAFGMGTAGKSVMLIFIMSFLAWMVRGWGY